MKLTIRPLQQGRAAFVVEAEPSETIHDLKLRISEEGFPVEVQNLLNTGKQLQDDKTIASYGIKEASTLVLMITGRAQSAAVSPSASISNSPRTAPGTLGTPPPTVSTPAQTASTNRLSVPSPAYATQATVPPVAAASSAPRAISEISQSGPAANGAGIYSNVGPSQSNINAIVGMGFTQDQAVRALRASVDNVDQAIELLLNDPDNLGAGSASRTAQPNFPANVSRLANGASPQTSGLPQSMIPQNLMNMVAQQQQQQELPDLSSMSLGGLGSASSGAATAEVSREQIEEIRRLVAFNPTLTKPLLERFKQEDPDLYNYIDNDPEKLLRALSQDGDDSGPSAPPARASHLPSALPPAPAHVPQRVTQPTTETRTVGVTQEEHQAIQRLVELGFDEQTVLQAYLACDRDAERAADFLLCNAVCSEWPESAEADERQCIKRASTVVDVRACLRVPYKLSDSSSRRHQLMLLHLSLSVLVLTGAAYAKTGAVTDYAPLINQPCPNTTTDPLLRVFTPRNQSLHPDEAAYVDTRLTTVIPNEWKNWVGDGSGIGYNLSAFNNSFPKIGIAVSGGGCRAAQFGAGALSGLDARNDSAKQAGTGGLLQVASYLSGLSGGSWLTGSLYMNDFPTIKDLVYGNGDNLAGWLLDLGLATPDGIDIFSDQNQHYYGSILWSVIAKGNTSIDTSLTDPWARMISYHFLNQTDRKNFFSNETAHGAGQLWSNVPLIPSWQQHLVPFPIIQANSRPVGSNLTTALSPTAVVYEITPLEWGSWDPNLSAMMNMSYAGTHLNNGNPDNDTACVTSFDQTGFMMGTSASLFNQLLDFAHNTIEGFDDSAAKSLLNILSRQLGKLRTRADDVANWPSPFYNLTGKSNFEDLNFKWLELIDGSSNSENVPLGQHFVKARGIDVVVAIDSTADLSTNWPNGSSLSFSAERITNLLQSSHQQFPPLPGNADLFISTGVNMRPAFFGCFPTQTPPEYPMVIYFPNSPPLNGDDPVSNSGTFQLEYTPLHTQLFLDQVHVNVIGGFLPGTNLPDPNFGKCTQCAAIDRARLKTNPPLQRSAFCNACFAQYCFDPNNLTSAAVQLPGRKLAFVDPDPEGVSALTGFLSDSKLAIILGFLAAALVVAAICAFLLLRKRRQMRSAEYQKVMNLHDDEDEPPFIQHNMMHRDNPTATPSYELNHLVVEPYVPDENHRQ